MKHLADHITRFKKSGYKVTHQRLVILDYLLNSKEHPSAEKIYADLREKFPTISLATIYNTLEMLLELDLAIDVGALAERRRFDGNVSEHSHFFCQGCGKIEDLEIYPLKELKNTLLQERNLRIVRHRLDFFGWCPDCQTKTR
ncbi:MAG: transcriptional repressor [Firmicutes bacterium]|nr:transcriptional repressor [Bacillota bacterium]